MYRLYAAVRRALPAFALCLPLAAQAAETGALPGVRVIAPGGELDPAKRPLDVYIDKPVAAKADPNTACKNAEEYNRRVNSGQYAEIADLFTADAVFMEPTKTIAAGTQQIRDFYVNFIGRMRPTIVSVAYVGNDTDCMVMQSSSNTLDGRERYLLSSVNFFTLGEGGRFNRMIAFSRGNAVPRPVPAPAP